MNSNYVYSDNEFGNDADLGFSAAKGASAGAAAGTVVPGVGNAAGAAVGSLAAIGSQLIGGSKEKGSGTTKPNTLAHAIDKYEKANDLEAVELAKKAAQMKINGQSEQQIASIIATGLGYPDDGGLITSHKWAYVSRMLDQVALQAQAQQTQAGGAGGGYTAKAGIGKYVLIGGGVLVTMGIIATMAK